MVRLNSDNSEQPVPKGNECGVNGIWAADSHCREHRTK